MKLLSNMQKVRLLWLVSALVAVVTLAVGSAEAELNYAGSVELNPVLPNNVVPTSYRIHLSPFLRSRRYNGEVTIMFDTAPEPFEPLCNKIYDVFRSSNKNEKCIHEGSMDRIVLHAARSIQIKEITVDQRSKVGSKHVEVKNFTRDAENQMIAVNLKKKLHYGQKGTYSVTIKFEGKIKTDEMYGFYMSEFAGEEYAITQFQPTGARLVFPCFDEPRFKTNIKLIVSARYDTQVFSNMPRIWEETTPNSGIIEFKTSPPMSIHMFAFAIGPFLHSEIVYLPRTETRGKISVEVSAPGEQLQGGKFAVKIALEAIKRMEAYTGIDYPLPKLDIVAVPGLQNDNAENWGLVFIRNNVSLFDDKNSREDAKIAIAVNVAHVVVHQWFGNLITASEWDDLWITEMVAAQMAFEIVQEIMPHVQSEYFVRAATLSGVLNTDVGPGSHPLSPKYDDLLTSDGVRKIFDLISFTKGASLMQLLKNTYGASKIRLALQTLVRNNMYSNINRHDLFAALAPFGIDVTPPMNKGVTMEQVISSWINGAGYQKIGVSEQKTETGGNIRLSITHVKPSTMSTQRPLGQPPSEDLALEFNFYNSEGKSTRETQRYSTWCFASESHSCNVVAPKWYDPGNERHFVKVSPHPNLSTYYRVFYENKLRLKIANAIGGREIQDPMDRLHILDDATGLARIGALEPNELEELIRAYGHEEHPGVLLGLFVANKTSVALGGDSGEVVTNAFMKNVFEKYDGFKVRGDEPMLEQRIRSLALKELVLRNEMKVVEAALEAFKEARENNSNVAPFLREPVYAAVALHGDDDQVDAILDYGTKNDWFEEDLRIIDALTLSPSEQTLSKVSAFMARSTVSMSDLEPFIQRSKLDASEIAKLRNKMHEDTKEGVEL